MKKVTHVPTDTHAPTRRSFLKLCGLLGLGAAASSLLPTERAEALLFGKRDYKVSDTRLRMGSFLSITTIHPSRDEAQNAIGLAYEEIDRLSKIFSRHDPATPLSALNRTGTLNEAPPELVAVVKRALDYHRLTNGAFDVTVQPVVDLFKERFAAGHTPTETEIAALLPRIGSQYLRLTDNTITFGRDAMGITLDGIAPGYIVDQVSALLTKLGVANHLINASGDIRTAATADKKAPWTVAIQDPTKNKEYPAVVSMASGAISTSGDYEAYYDQEKMFHHIVDPMSGHSPILSTSATTRATTCMDADALATGMMVMPPAAGLALIARLTGNECFLIGRDNRSQQSGGWQAMG